MPACWTKANLGGLLRPAVVPAPDEAYSRLEDGTGVWPMDQLETDEVTLEDIASSSGVDALAV